jgi:hypothetical protein
MTASELDLKWPLVKQKGCEFSNGGWAVKRDLKWLMGYKRDIEDVVLVWQHNQYNAYVKSGIWKDYGLDEPHEFNPRKPWTYGWFRELDDSNGWPYRFALRATNVCETCYREWGQMYYAIHCHHDGKSG